jgi:hypothetical protein
MTYINDALRQVLVQRARAVKKQASVALPPCGRYTYPPLHIMSFGATPVIGLVWRDQFQSRAEAQSSATL